MPRVMSCLLRLQSRAHMPYAHVEHTCYLSQNTFYLSPEHIPSLAYCLLGTLSCGTPGAGHLSRGSKRSAASCAVLPGVPCLLLARTLLLTTSTLRALSCSHLLLTTSTLRALSCSPPLPCAHSLAHHLYLARTLLLTTSTFWILLLLDNLL
jgi:hypothetical protein